MKIVTDLSITSAPHRARHGWHPGWLFRSGAQGAWFDPSTPETRSQDTLGVTPAVQNDPLGLLRDQSGNGNDALQATLPHRPLLGRMPESGIRNFLRYSERFDHTDWFKIGASVTPDAAIAPDGQATADKLIEDTSTGQHLVLLSPFPAIQAGETHTLSIFVKAAERSRLYLRDNATPNVGAFFDLAAGAVIQNDANAVASSITAVGEGWYRCAITYVSTASTANTHVRLVASGTATSYQGDGASGLYAWGIQLEQGSAATGYQRANTELDITESGERSLWYVFDNQINHALAFDPPDLGPSATLAYASDEGISILPDQNIPAGAFQVLQGTRLFGLLVINRGLDGAETTRLNNWLRLKSGSPL